MSVVEIIPNAGASAPRRMGTSMKISTENGMLKKCEGCGEELPLSSVWYNGGRRVCFPVRGLTSEEVGKLSCMKLLCDCCEEDRLEKGC